MIYILHAIIISAWHSRPRERPVSSSSRVANLNQFTCADRCAEGRKKGPKLLGMVGKVGVAWEMSRVRLQVGRKGS